MRKPDVKPSPCDVEFWDFGHELFRSTPDSFPVPFLEGDLLNPEHLSVVTPFTKANPPAAPIPRLATLTSLNPLHGHVSAIYAASIFHLADGSRRVRNSEVAAPVAVVVVKRRPNDV